MDDILKKIVKLSFTFILKVIKKFFTVIFEFILGLFILVFLITLIALSFDEEKNFLKEKTYLLMSFQNDFGAREDKDFFDSIMKKDYDFYTVLKGIENAKKDNKIKGIILDMDKFYLSSVYMDELEIKLDEFKKSGKKIIAFGTNYDNRNYRMALVADEIIMPPSASTNIHLTAYYAAIPYFKNIGDKIGVKYNVINVGDYKSFGENYTRNEISPELKSELERIYEIKHKEFKEKISEKRQISNDILDTKFENGEFVLLNSYEALEQGLIDKTVFYEDEFKDLEIKNFSNYLALIEKSEKEKEINLENIAVIYLNGEIITRDIKNNGFASGTTITPYSFKKNLDKALEDEKIKGIILRIDSPGGSPLASEIILNLIKEASELKPVYVSMGSVAASGGYYISASAKKIFLSKETITGSIGVVSLLPNFYELSQKIGLDFSIISKGKYAGIYDVTKETSEEELELIKAKMQKIYKEFKTRVSEGRNLTMESVEEIAQGKIWTGEEAVEIGLADGIGGLDYSIKRMAKDLELTNYGVISYESKTDFLSLLKEKEFTKVLAMIKSEKSFYSFLKNDYRVLIYGKSPITLMPYEFN